MVKRILAATALAVSVAFAGGASGTASNFDGMAVASAATADEQFTGNWYDAKGNFVVSIQPGVINSCRIVRTYDVKEGTPGSGHFVILEANGEHDLFIEWEGGDWQNNNYVEPHITIDHGQKLTRK